MFLLLLLSLVSKAQPRETPSGFSIVIGGGLYPGSFLAPYEFQSSAMPPTELNTLYYAKAGVSYSPIQFLNETNLSFSLELLYGFISTREEQSSSTTKLALSGNYLFVAFWSKIYVPATLSPFIRIGIGHFENNLKERYSPSGIFPDLNRNQRNIGFGGSGGVDWRLNDSITLSFYAEGAVAPGEAPFSFSMLAIGSSLAL